jgi:hypothetical protein
VARIGCQLGHVPRKTGITGTGGEQEYVQRLFTALEPKLKAAGHTPIKILADPEDGVYPAMDAFFAFHCDGNDNHSARGCSFGFRTDLPNATASKAFGDRWRFEHAAAGYPGGNRPTNNTDDLAHYYALRPATNKGAKRAICIEFGFLTNKDDNDWLIANVGAVADALVRTVVAFFGGTAPPPQEDLSIVDKQTREFLDAQFKTVHEDFVTVLRGKTHKGNLDNIVNIVTQIQNDMQLVKQKLNIPS